MNIAVCISHAVTCTYTAKRKAKKLPCIKVYPGAYKYLTGTRRDGDGKEQHTEMDDIHFNKIGYSGSYSLKNPTHK